MTRGSAAVGTAPERRGGQVPIAVKAPRHVDAHRAEGFAAPQPPDRPAGAPSAAALGVAGSLPPPAAAAAPGVALGRGPGRARFAQAVGRRRRWRGRPLRLSSRSSSPGPPPAELVLIEAELDPDPIRQFERWFDDAVTAGIPEPHAMTLATAG